MKKRETPQGKLSPLFSEDTSQGVKGAISDLNTENLERLNLTIEAYENLCCRNLEKIVKS